MIGKFKDMVRLAGGEWLLSFVTRDDPRRIIDKLKDCDIDIELAKHSRLRSQEANKLCWALCSDIGRAMTPPVSRLEVYRMAIVAVGCYIDKVLFIWDVDTVRRRWEGHGDGWVFQIVDDAGTGKKLCRLHFGSSTYTVSEMRVLLDWLVDQAEQMEIPLRMSKEDEERALAQWGKAFFKETQNPATSAEE